MYKILMTVLTIIAATFFVPSNAIAQDLHFNGKIAFASNQDGDYEIYVMDSNGSNVQQVTFNTDYDNQPVWSPDGNKILFSSDRDGGIKVFVMNADGSNPINLTPDFGSFGGRWSPDGTKIAFSAKIDSIGENVYMMNADGTNKVNLTRDATYINSMPFWSRNGTQIFFVTTRNYPLGPATEPSPVDVYSISLDGSNLTKIFGAGIGMTSINLSPDGTRIIYGIWRLGPTLIVRDLKTGNESILADGIQAGGSDPAWSPDGAKIVFNSDGFSIATMDANGDNHTILLTVASTTGLTSPDWQPVISESRKSTLTKGNEP